MKVHVSASKFEIHWIEIIGHISESIPLFVIKRCVVGTQEDFLRTYSIFDGEGRDIHFRETRKQRPSCEGNMGKYWRKKKEDIYFYFWETGEQAIFFREQVLMKKSYIFKNNSF